jgi:hypothetical protein
MWTKGEMKGEIRGNTRMREKEWEKKGREGGKGRKNKGSGKRTSWARPSGNFLARNLFDCD